MGTLRNLGAALCLQNIHSRLLHVQVTTDYLDRLRQMKVRMTGIKTRVETVSAASESLRMSRDIACCSGITR